MRMCSEVMFTDWWCSVGLCCGRSLLALQMERWREFQLIHRVTGNVGSVPDISCFHSTAWHFSIVILVRIISCLGVLRTWKIQKIWMMLEKWNLPKVGRKVMQAVCIRENNCLNLEQICEHLSVLMVLKLPEQTLNKSFLVVVAAEPHDDRSLSCVCTYATSCGRRPVTVVWRLINF